MIPYGKQSINDSDVESVLDVLKSNFLTQGPQVPKFEEELSGQLGVRFAVAMNSATSALHSACLALDVGPGDIVWTSAISFVASANCAVYCGAEVNFVDVNPTTGNMSIQDLEDRLLKARKDGKLPKVVIPVHFAGQPVDVEAISKLGVIFGFKIIEDASHALGSSYSGSIVGSCEFSDVTVFSFHPVKMITTGEGGVATTNCQKIQSRLQRIRSHGITRAPDEIDVAYEGSWFYDQIELGFNYRMTDLQAALGRSQLKRLNVFVDKRAKLASKYDAGLGNLAIVPLDRDVNAQSSWHLYVILVENAKMRKPIFDKLTQDGILANIHYRPIYRQSYYARSGKYDPSDFPNAEAYYASAISLPLFPSLTDTQLGEVIQSLASPPGHQTIF